MNLYFDTGRYKELCNKDELTEEEKEELFDLYLLEEYIYYGEV